MNPANPYWINISVEAWRVQQVKLNDGALSSTIDALEWELGFKFPEDFKQLYSLMDGFPDFEMDTNMISMWCLKRISLEYADADGGDFIGFCDLLIQSHSIGFLKGSPGVFKKYYSTTGLEFKKMADSFQQAIALIHANSPLIY